MAQMIGVRNRYHIDGKSSGSTTAEPESLAHDRSQSAETRPITVIRPPSFSPRAFARSLVRLAQYRDLLATLTVHRLKVRYKQSVLGPSWALLQPIALMLIYTVIFSRIVQVSTNGTPYAIFAYSALLPWTFFSTSLSTATNSLVSHFSLVTKVYFPREILPLTYIAAALVDFLLASVVLGGLMVYYQTPPTVYALVAVPALAVLIAFSLGASLLLCAIQVRYRDIGVAMPLVLQLWMFASPVVYPLSAVPARWRGLYALNPVVGVVENFRRALVGGAAPDLHSLAVAAIVSSILLPLAFAYFKHVEATVADII
jgi:lipopolysaccharide transport system permease protein